jgi:AcrR family transcriptional regulator
MMDTTTAKPAKAARADACRNEDRLLAVARAAFVEKGIDSSLEDIARQAGVGIGTLYRHFPNRQALVEAVLRDHMVQLIDEADQLLQENNAYEALVTWLQDVLHNITTYRGATKPMAQALQQCDGVPSTTCQLMRDAGERLVQRAQERGDVRKDVAIDDVMAIINAVGWIAEQGNAETSKRSLQVFLDGIRAPK